MQIHLSNLVAAQTVKPAAPQTPAPRAPGSSATSGQASGEAAPVTTPAKRGAAVQFTPAGEFRLGTQLDISI